MATAYLGLGSNLGDRVRAMKQAWARLESGGQRVIARSSLYETEPWGITDQPRFINAASAVETDLPPHALLALLKDIEQAMGRRDGVRYGPRRIDIDILLYEGIEICTETLCIPHPGMTERLSVLVPLAEIATDVRHPGTGLNIGALLARLGPVTGVAPCPPGLPAEPVRSRPR